MQSRTESKPKATNHSMKAMKECASCVEESDATAEPVVHPDHKNTFIRLRRISGQVQGLEKMILERRYCVDILVQFRAVSKALAAVEMTIVKSHMESCVKNAFTSKDKKKAEAKIQELMEFIENRI